MKRPLLDVLVRRYKNTPLQKNRDEWFCCVMTGEVTVDGHRERDPKAPVEETARIDLTDAHPYVSRAGNKLAHGLDVFEIDVTDLVVLDAGASTGGFTDCLLRRGARTVHAVDVGYNQLAYVLRADPRVVVRERTNIMDVSALEPPADFAVMDLSFRSIRRVAAHAARLTRQRRVVALVKPQFELAAELRAVDRASVEAAARGKGGLAPDTIGGAFGGVVRSEAERRRVLEKTLADLATEGLRCLQTTDSPVAGRYGNREYLVYLVLD